MHIRAAVVDGDNKISLREIELDGPGQNEVLVRIVATGVCHTDLKCGGSTILVKKRPVVLGHEGAGIVEAVGTGVTAVSPGDHVVMTFESCGRCSSCMEAEPAYCHDQFALNFGCGRPGREAAYLCSEVEPIHGDFFGQSSFATFAIGSERNVVKVPRDVPLEILGPLACGIQTGAGAVFHDLSVRPGDAFAVFGVGSVGLSAVMAARHVGAGTIIAVDRNPERLAMARELGADVTINSADAAAAIKNVVKDGVHHSLDTTGNAAAMRQAIEVLAPRGSCGFVAGTSDGTDLPVSVRTLLNGRKVMGIVEGNSNPHLFIPMLIELYRQERFPFDRLVTMYPFEDIGRALADLEAGRTIKPVLRMDAAA